MTDLHPAAKPEHVRKVLDDLKALERRLIAADQWGDPLVDSDGHTVGRAIIVIDVLANELHKRLRSERYAALLPTAGRAVAGPVTYDEDPDYLWDGHKDGWLDEDGNVNEPPDVEP